MAVTGDTRWAAAFRAGMLGFYVQDNFSATDRLDLTFGLRADIPLFFDTPAENATFNDFMASRGWNYKTNSKLNSRPLFLPAWVSVGMSDRRKSMYCAEEPAFSPDVSHTSG